MRSKRTPFTISATVAFVLVSVIPRPVPAQVNVQVQLTVPTIRFETAPVLVEVSPGIQVVPDYDQEVFFVDGWYWSRSGRVWYRTRDHRGGWVVVQERAIPMALVRVPPGKYKHYKDKHYKDKGSKTKEKKREMAGGDGGHGKHKKFKEKKNKRK